MNSIDRRKKNSKWIQDTGISKHRGTLHRELGVPLDKPLSMSKLKSVAGGDSKLARRARLAMTLKGFKH